MYCYVQANKWDPQAIAYPVTGTHHRLHNSDKTKSQLPGICIKQRAENDGATNLDKTAVRYDSRRLLLLISG